MKAKFVRYSVCDCGFPILRDGIQLGAIYDIDYSKMRPITVICGGCYKPIRLIGVWVESRDGGRAGYLPERIFQAVTETKTKPKNEQNHEKNETTGE